MFCFREELAELYIISIQPICFMYYKLTQFGFMKEQINVTMSYIIKLMSHKGNGTELRINSECSSTCDSIACLASSLERSKYTNVINSIKCYKYRSQYHRAYFLKKRQNLYMFWF